MIKNTVKLFAKIFLFATLSQQVFAESPRLLNSYAELLATLSKGYNVRAIINLNKCTSTNGSQNANDAIAGMNFTNFNKYQIPVGNQQKNIIATSITLLVQHPILGEVDNYVRLRVFEDNSVEVYSEYLDPKSFTELGSATATCELSDDKNQRSISLYVL